MKITICGSIGFYKEMETARDELIKFGHEVKIPELTLEVPPEFGEGRKIYFGQYVEQNGGIDAFPSKHKIWDLKEGAINDHFLKIDWCEGILVVNHEKRGIRGYVGGNTLIEIGVAFYLKKKIYILNQVSSNLSYKQEIMGMKPTILNGNLAGLK
ncbi:MAG: hypothetical protein M1153_02155 [Patescibacteria group bacterium]|nr:hypothetical protein [Patescibacteria group bacterium]